jgi:SsrA-binding protein
MSSNLICRNRKARFLYHIEETWEAGIVLLGSEVKALREGKANLQDSYARVENGEIYLHQMHIGPYGAAHAYNHDARRIRKLLLHRREIQRLVGKVEERGLTLIPLRLYFKNDRVKVELGLARGKRVHDKREDIKKREAEREVQRAWKGRGSGSGKTFRR